jgi:protein SCO1/2
MKATGLFTLPPALAGALLLGLALVLSAAAPSRATDDAQAQHDHAQHDHADPEQATAAQQMEAIDPHAHHKQAAAAQEQSTMARVDMPDSASLLNQFGEPVNFPADVIGDRVAVVNFVYTHCTTVCPVTSSIFSMVQQHLGEQVGKDVALVTITVDPVRDSPQRLLGFSKSFNPGAGWSWLTGEKRNVDRVLDAFGAYTVSFEDHPAMVLIGDESRGTWYRLYGFPAPEAIESRVRELLQDRES